MQYFDRAIGNRTFDEIGESLRSTIASAEPRLQAIEEAQASVAPGLGKWSPKQILGHLIDSASNNHQRFVRAQSETVLRLQGYAQDHWVAAQHYGESSWPELIELWSAYNRHLAHVIAKIPESLRGVSCEIGESAPVPLSDLALDYVGHVDHHLGQILG